VPEEVEVAETKEAAPSVMIDLDASGQLIGVEVSSVRIRGNRLYGSARVPSPAEPDTTARPRAVNEVST
jgi:hypothetical protein